MVALLIQAIFRYFRVLTLLSFPIMRFSHFCMILAIYFGFLSMSIVPVDANTYPIVPKNPILCTMQYAPVCGYTPIQCITTPCEPIRQTYGNSCMAGAAGAIEITQWECDDAIQIPIGQKPPPLVIGGVRDTHGCIGSAGYSWEARLGRCIRPWDESVSVINIFHENTPCALDSTQRCLQVKRRYGYEILPSPIIGFDYVAGYDYRLLVKREKLADLSYRYTLIRVLTQKKYSYTYLAGTDWSIASLDGNVITSPGTLSFTRNMISGKLCNTFSGLYTADWANISTTNMISTRMYCMPDVMSVEDALQFDNATYVLSENTLTIYTRWGNTIVWKKKVY